MKKLQLTVLGKQLIAENKPENSKLIQEAEFFINDEGLNEDINWKHYNNVQEYIDDHNMGVFGTLDADAEYGLIRFTNLVNKGLIELV